VTTKGQRLSYTDALKILGAHEGSLLRVLDTILSLAGLAVSASTLGVLDLFGAKEEVVELTRSSTGAVARRLRGVSRVDRTTLLEAAHGVLVLASYQDAVGDEVRSITDKTGLSPSAFLVQGNQDPAAASTRNLVELLTDEPLPIPHPSMPHDQFTRSIRHVYDQYSERLARVLDLVETGAGRRLLEASGEIGRRGLHVYGESIRTLSIEVPEFGLWACQPAIPATQAMIRDATDEARAVAQTTLVGLSGIEELLEQIRGATIVADNRRRELAAAYRSRLRRPVLDLGDITDDVELPTVEQIYVNLACRTDAGWTTMGPRSEEDEERVDLHRFVTSHLTSPLATEAPLLVQGLPGSGKSTMSTVIAGSLPSSDFLVLLIRLRDVPADAAVTDQIAFALREAIGHRTDWTELVRSANGALPVVIFDGLDELLLASDSSRSDFLEEVTTFQRTEAEFGRSVATIVTSRPTISYRVRIPRTTVQVHLQPLDPAQIRKWLAEWNRRTEASQTHFGRAPLDVELVLRLPDLAEQPLLLLLLAMYDLRTGGVADLPPDSAVRDLYEGVFVDFARREVLRSQPTIAPALEGSETERLMFELGMAALAFMNRHANVLTGTDLERDVAALLASAPRSPDRDGRGRSWIDLIEHFYFVHTSQATVGVGEVRRSFEFLHATFGDFLAARTIASVLATVVDERAFLQGQALAREPDCGLLRCMLSFHVLTDSPWALQLIGNALRTGTPAQTMERAEVLRWLRRVVLADHPTWSEFEAYAPSPLTATAKAAVFLANLLLLELELRPEGLTFEDGMSLSTTSQLLGSQIRSHSLRAFRAHVHAHHIVEWELQDDGYTSDANTTTTLRRAEPAGEVSVFDSAPSVVTQVNEESESIFGARVFRDLRVPMTSSEGLFLRQIALLGPGWTWVHDLIPLWRHLGIGPEPEGMLDGEQVGSANRLILELLLSGDEDFTPVTRAWMFQQCFAVRWGQADHVCRLLLRRLVHDAGHLSTFNVGECLKNSHLMLSEKDVSAEIVDLIRACDRPAYLATQFMDSIVTELFVSDSSGVFVEGGPDADPTGLMSENQLRLYRQLEAIVGARESNEPA